MINCHVARHRQCKSSLTHRGARCNDHQLGFLPSGSQPVELGEARWNSYQRILFLTQLLYLRQSLFDNLMYRGNLMLDISLRDPEQLILTPVKQLRHIKRVFINQVLDQGCSPYQLALYILLKDNTRMIIYVGCGDNLGGQLGQVNRPTDLFKFIHPLELLRDSKKVDRLITLVQLINGSKDLLMSG